MKNKFLFIQLFMIGLLLTLTNSCKKDDTTSSTKKDPIITWANPADITVSTLLSATQLNATADVPGNFVYTPAIGASLAVGANQDLKVDFTPADVVTYNVASKTVKINVTQPTGSGVSSVVFNGTLTYGSMTDQDGNTYKTITIGNQTWMAENLRVTKYRNGEAIPNITDNAAWTALTTGAYCSYKNSKNADSIATFGRLYNSYTVSDSRNIAPIGWHVPTDAEWSTLTTFLGGENVAGGKMKEAGTTHWLTPNTSATNESGFSATPVGRRSYINGVFGNLGDNGIYWSSTQFEVSSAWGRFLTYGYANCNRGNNIKAFGLAARLVKD